MTAATYPRGASRALYDLAHTFESAEGGAARVQSGLEQLRELVPYERCALLEVQAGRERRLTVVPELPDGEESPLIASLQAMLGLMSERHENLTLDDARVSGRMPRTWTDHLAVPLVGFDQVIGVLFVGRDDAPYDEQDLCLLSIAGAQIAAYLTTLRLHDEKDEFLAMLSHELRSPLGTVLGWAELLRDNPLDTEITAQAADVLMRSARSMSRIIEDLLDLSRLATGKLRLDLRPIDVTQTIQAAVQDAAPGAASRSIDLVSRLDGRAGLVNGDAERLRQVVSNLVGNAIKFTPEGGRVEVRTERTPDHVRIQVIDSGRGMSADLLPVVFERFRQADPGSRRGHDGLGLGLAIVQSLVELHGGRVHAESEGGGKGATFTVTLPLADQGR